MSVEPDNQEPLDDEGVGAEEQTANVEYSFDLSQPPSTERSRQADSKREQQHERTVNQDGLAEPGVANLPAASDEDPGPSMSILDVEKTIQEHPGSVQPLPASAAINDSSPDTADDTADSRTSPIGRYLVRRLLGQGAFGRVYEAHDPQLDRRVAVKVSKDVKGKSAIDRFLREARSAAHLRHPAIIPVFEYGQAGDLSMIVYELVDGETLRSYINRHAPLPLATTVSIIRKLAEGLDYAHGEGIIHRDMKPDNVLMDKNGEPHIADFGCARRFDDEDTGKTLEGSVLGTPTYMSPEQASGQSHEADGRTDVWSLGVMLYEMVSGQKPFEGKLTDVMHLIKHHDAKPLRKVHPGTPVDIETICSKCLRRELEYRFASAGELADELERFERGEPILSRRINVLTRTWLWAKRNPAVASLLTAVVVTLAAGLTASMLALWQANYQYNQRAQGALEQLQTAESSALDDILVGLKEWDQPTMLTKIQENLNQPIAAVAVADRAKGNNSQLRLEIALLHLRDNQDELECLFADDKIDGTIAALLSADGQEMVSFSSACNDREKVKLSSKLWKRIGIGIDGQLLESHETNNNRFKAACALAQLDHASPNWNLEEKNIAQDVADYLSAMNLDEVQQWLPTVAPIREKIKTNLEAIFAKRSSVDDASPENAAAIISFMHLDTIQKASDDDVVEGEIREFINFIAQAKAARQLAHLIPALESNERASAFLRQRLEEMNSPGPGGTAGSALSRANLVLALIQLRSDDAWQVLYQENGQGTDNSVGTEVIERWGPASRSADVLLAEVDRFLARQSYPSMDEKSRRVDDYGLAVALLALGQFTDGQIPSTTKKDNVLPTLKNIFQFHPNGRVHSSARWLMNRWGFGTEVQQLETKLRQLHPDPEKNWHVDMFGNTFVLFRPEDGRRSFGICIHEVTCKQYAQFVDHLLTQREFELEMRPVFDAWHQQLIEENENQPMTDGGYELLDFYKSLQFCSWLSGKHDLELALPTIKELEDLRLSQLDSVDYQHFDLSRYGYRLPTAREWQFACGAGTTTKRSFGSNDTRLTEFAWYLDNSQGRDHPHPVGQKKPNEAGLFDMLGNVRESCLDYYPQSGSSPEWNPEDGISWEDEFTVLQIDGIVQATSTHRESRGGSYDQAARDLYTAKRAGDRAKAGNPHLGFRLARTYPTRPPVHEPAK